jgi:LAO/AO transport system kinase
MSRRPRDLGALRRGGKAALARALTALETHGDAPDLVGLLDAAYAAPRGVVLGLTGPPGVGKSTLTGTLIARLRARGRTVGVVAVDPSSRRSRGALLGDRTRIETDPDDEGVFLRSMAARDRLGGLSEFAYPAAILMRAVFDWVIVETVGVGQSETEVKEVADLVVLCAQPGSGDALQYMKAGIVETPDLVLVTKGDLGALARRTAADLRGALSLAAGEDDGEAKVLVVSSETGAGVEAALDQIESLGAAALAPGAADRRRRQAAAWAEAQLRDSFGRKGAALLGSVEGGLDAPFSALAKRRARLARILERARQTV